MVEAHLNEVERIKAALACIPPDLAHEDWARVAAALKDGLGDAGFAVFDDWSKGGKSYVESNARSTWNYYKPGRGITVGTLFHYAKRHGYADDGLRHIPDRAEVERTKAKRAADNERAEAKRASEAVEAAKRAQAVWKEASPAFNDHPYLQRKGLAAVDTLREIDADALRALIDYAPQSSGKPLSGRILCVPVKVGSDLSTLEFIDGDGRKTALKGGMKSSGFWSVARIPDTTNRILIAEGVATAMSAHACAGYPAVAALSCGNLLKVVQSLRTTHPDAMMIVLGDMGNGEKKAREAAQEVGGALAVPDFGPGAGEGLTDFNDLHVLRGADAVRDAINAVADAAVCKTQSLVTPPPSEDNSGPHARYVVSDDGVHYVGVRHDSKSEKDVELPPIKLCDELQIIGRGEDDSGQNYRILRWRSRGSGTERSIAFPLAEVGEREGWSRLRGLGLAVSTGRQKNELLAEFLQAHGSDELHRVTALGGWQHGGYITPSGEVLGKPSSPVFFNGDRSAAAAYVSTGTVESWRESVACLAHGNTRPMLAIGVALAAPLLSFVDLESGGIHLFGKSGSGKTTSAKVGGSVWGAPRQQGSCCSMSLGQGTADAVARASYVVFNGVSRMQGARDGGNRDQARWRVLVLSTGEVDLAGFMNAGGHRARAGQEVRLASLAADAGKGFGAFDQLNGYADSGLLADALDEATRSNHGAVGRAFVLHVAANREAVAARLRVAIKRVHDDLPKGASGQVRRVAARFALVADALEIATEIGLTGWEPDDGRKAVMRCLSEWMAGFGVGNREDEQMLDQAEQWFGAHAYTRFADCREGLDHDMSRMVFNNAGYLKKDDLGATYWLVLRGVFEAEIASGFHKTGMGKVLAQHGMLVLDKQNRCTTTSKIPGMRGATDRFYKFISIVRKIEHEDDDVR
ncbi:DUF927 domain-containing protein [Paraburkholderia sp. CI3]|uniref:DUF927 domain-containing protein n=1 Tax=Paraburkholderia sp. CI3 TaxID=2991060 RepID=UPI003D238929